MQNNLGNMRVGFRSINAWNSEYDYFFTLPEEIQQAVNEHADQFQSMEQMRAFAEDLMKRS